MKDNLCLDLYPSVLKPPAAGLGGYYNKKSLTKQKAYAFYFQNIRKLFDLHIFDQDLAQALFKE